MILIISDELRLVSVDENDCLPAHLTLLPAHLLDDVSPNACWPGPTHLSTNVRLTR